MQVKDLVLVGAILLTIRGPAVGSIIDDKSQFVGDFTVIDFETFADGTPIVLEPNHGGSIWAGMYGSLGVWITAETVPVIFRGDFPQWIAAHEASGSGLNAISDVGGSGFLRFDFTVPVNAFGLAVMHVPDRGTVSFAAFDVGDQLIESVEFLGDLVDGVVPGSEFGNPYDYEYGFLGLYAPSREIAYGVVSQGSSGFDDLHYGIIPEPWTLALLLGGVGLVGLARLQRPVRAMMSPMRGLRTHLKRGTHMYARHFIGISAVMLAVHTSAIGSIIDDKSDFVGDYTVIDFETFADGTPIILEPGQGGSILPNFYSSLGVWITAETVPVIFHGALSHWIPAHEAIASRPNVISDVGTSGFLRFDFTVPVNAFGLAVMTRSDGDPVSLAAFDAKDQLIQSTDFLGDLVDGTVSGTDFGNPYDIEYGFVGLFTEDPEMSYAIVSQAIARFDDLHFGVIPEPGTLGLLGLSVFVATYSRRRKLGRVPIRVACYVAISVSLALSNPVLADSDITGHVQGWVDLTEGPICGDNGWPDCPPHDGLTLIDLEGVRVCILDAQEECQVSAFTGPDGTYTIEYEGSGEIIVKPDLDGQWARVGKFEELPNGGIGFVLSDLIPAQDLASPPYTGIDFVFNPDGASVPFPERDASEVTAFYHATQAHGFFRDRQPSDLSDFTQIDDVPVIVDTGMLIAGSCNYKFLDHEDLGRIIGLSPSFGQVCANAASRSSVPFTYGLFVAAVRSLPQNMYFRLGIGEAFALLATNDPILYPNQHVDSQAGHSFDFEGDPPAARRSLADDCDSVGLCHEILAGIWWDIKLNMETKYEDEEPGAGCPIEGLTGTECGLEVTRRLFVRWTLMTEGFDLHRGPDRGPTIALDLLATDDENDDVSDGRACFYGLRTAPAKIRQLRIASADAMCYPGSAIHRSYEHI